MTYRELLAKLCVVTIALLISSAATTPVWTAPPPQKPWTKDQIIRMLKGDVPPKRIGELARERGIDFQITTETEAEVRQSAPGGAPTQEVDALLLALREIAPKPVPPPLAEPAVLFVESAPGGVQVYIDDEFKGATSQEGKLKITGLPTGQHRVRLSLQGYNDKEDQVEIVAGATQTYRAELTAHTQPTTATPVGAVLGAIVGGGDLGTTPAQPATPAKTEVAPSNPALATFQIFHLVWGRHNWHPGTLVMYPGRVTWTEAGQDAKPEDNFSITCAEIVDVGKNSGLGYSSLKTQTHNYHFSGDGRTVKGFADAFAAACPGLGIH